MDQWAIAFTIVGISFSISLAVIKLAGRNGTKNGKGSYDAKSVDVPTMHMKERLTVLETTNTHLFEDVKEIKQGMTAMNSKMDKLTQNMIKYLGDDDE